MCGGHWGHAGVCSSVPPNYLLTPGPSEQSVRHWLDAACAGVRISGGEAQDQDIRLLAAAGGALAPHYHRHRQAPAPGCWAGRVRNHTLRWARASAPPDTAPRWCDRDTGSGNSDIRTSGVLDTNICFFTCLCVYVPKSVIGIGIINE